MANINWFLPTNISQAFDRRPSSAFHTMLGMMASYVRGTEGFQNRYIGGELGVSERSVRRWRNQDILPNERDWRYFFTKMYNIINLKKERFYPIGFNFLIHEYAFGLSYQALNDEYEASEETLVKHVNRNQRVIPQPLAKSQRAIVDMAGGGNQIDSGMIALKYEKATQGPSLQEVVNVTQIKKKVKKGKVVSIETQYVTQTIDGYVDYFNPYDIPTMLARIQAALVLIDGYDNNLFNALNQLYFVLTRQYSFYAPGETKLPNATLNPTVKFMRWLVRVLELANSSGA